MDGIAVLLILLLVFSAIGKSKKQQGQQKTARQRQRAPEPYHNAHHQQKKPLTLGQKPLTAMERDPLPDRSQPYQPIQPRLLERTPMHDDYVGSLGPASTEGASTEGEASAEGEDLCDPSLEHAAAPRLPVEEPVHEQPPIRALPDRLTADVMVQAVVMSEILNRPHGRWVRR